MGVLLPGTVAQRKAIIFFCLSLAHAVKLLRIWCWLQCVRVLSVHLTIAWQKNAITENKALTLWKAGFFLFLIFALGICKKTSCVMPHAQHTSVCNSKILCFPVLSLDSVEWNSNHWIPVCLLSYAHQGFTYQLLLCIFHSDLGFPFQRRPKVLFKDSNSVISVVAEPKEAELYPKWRLHLPCSAITPKFAGSMRLLKS